MYSEYVRRSRGYSLIKLKNIQLKELSEPISKLTKLVAQRCSAQKVLLKIP